MKSQSCCFTEHRKYSGKCEIQKRLEKELINFIERGVFISARAERSAWMHLLLLRYWS